MTDRLHNNKCAKVAAIVDDAIAELLMLGLDSRDDAASMMAALAILRINDPEIMKEIAQYAADFCEDGE